MTLLEDLKEEEAEQEAGNASDGAYAADLLRRAIAEVKRLQGEVDRQAERYHKADSQCLALQRKLESAETTCKTLSAHLKSAVAYWEGSEAKVKQLQLELSDQRNDNASIGASLTTIREQRAEVERLQAVVGGKFESLGFLPTTILGRLEMKLPSGKWLVLQDCSRLGLALESHSSHVDWARAAEAAEKHKHVCGLQGFDPNRDECDGCREAAEAYRKAKGR